MFKILTISLLNFSLFLIWFSSFETSAILHTGNPNEDAVLTDRLPAVAGMSLALVMLTICFNSRISQNIFLLSSRILLLSSRSRRNNTSVLLSNALWHSSPKEAIENMIC